MIEMNSKSSYIRGADLCKFYSRPIDIKTKQKNRVVIESDSDDDLPLPEKKEDSPEPTKFVTVAIQTDYRESETQTEPWDPPFYINRTYKKPEVLCLKELSYGNGLPATHLEIDYILENRRNDLLDAPSEGLDTYQEFLKKKKLISHQVKNDWNYKISKHSEKQIDKLKQMETSLAKELSTHSERKEKLLKNVWTKKNNQMVKINSKLRKELVKEIKILEQKCKTDGQKFDTKRIGTQTQTKELYHVDNHRDSLNEEMSHLLSKYYNNPNGLSKVTDWLERKKTEIFNEIPCTKPIHRDKREMLTEKAYQDLLGKKRTQLPPKLYREDYDKEESIDSSIKGEVQFDILELPEEGIDLVTVFQQVLRGRAYQKQMIKLIEKHKDSLDVLLV